MKILFMIPNLGQGGAEKVLINLVNNLDRERYDITVLTLFDEGVNRQFLGDHVRYRSVFKRTFPGNSKMLSLFPATLLHRLFIREQYDVEISYLEGITARVIAGGKKRNRPHRTICWIHSTPRNIKVASCAFRSTKEAQMCYESFDQIVGVSQSVSENFQQIFHLKQAPSVLYNTVESKKILELSQEPVSDSVFATNDKKIITAGSLKQVKGFDRLLRIHQRLRKHGIPVHTYLLGIGPDETALKAQAKMLGIEDSVTFLGYHTNPYKYVANCDLFVCSSHAEGFSTATTEALIVGTPVCTTEVSGAYEMLGDNEYGIVTANDEDSLYNGVYQLLSNDALLCKYRSQASVRGKDFSVEQTVGAVQELLQNL